MLFFCILVYVCIHCIYKCKQIFMNVHVHLNIFYVHADSYTYYIAYLRSNRTASSFLFLSSYSFYFYAFYTYLICVFYIYLIYIYRICFIHINTNHRFHDYSTILGVFVSTDVYDYSGTALYNAFHFLELLTVFIGITFIFQAILLILSVAVRKRALLSFSVIPRWVICFFSFHMLCFVLLCFIIFCCIL